MCHVAIVEDIGCRVTIWGIAFDGPGSDFPIGIEKERAEIHKNSQLYASSAQEIFFNSTYSPSSHPNTSKSLLFEAQPNLVHTHLKQTKSDNTLLKQHVKLT